MVRTVPRGGRVLAHALALLMAGCAVDAGCPGEHCAPVAVGDAGAVVPSDASDRGPFADGGRDAGLRPPSGEFAGDAVNGDLCWNGIDDDMNGLTDCDEVGCDGTPFCCLGRSSATCCEASSPVIVVDFTRCAGVDPALCGSTATAFGVPRLEGTVPSRAFVPNGQVFDAGLVYAAALDGTRQVIELEASVAAPVAGCTDCVDAVALAIGDAVAGDVVRPDVAVLVRASRRDYALLVAGEVVASRPLLDDAARTYVLRLSPDGEVRLTVGDETLVARWLPRSDRRALLYGRTQNRPADAPPPARVLGLRVRSDLCEIPSALEHDGGALVPDASWGALDARAPSAQLDGDSILLAFELGPSVHLARLARDGSLTLGGSGDVDRPVLPAGRGEALRDPELVREGDRWVLYVTRHRDGARHLARAEGGGGLAEVFSAPVDLHGSEGLSAPTVAQFRDRWLLAAVAETAGTKSIVLRELVDGALVVPGQHSSFVLATASADVHAFDADEVGGPELHVDAAGILRLYYAGRRGTRWSIGMRASGDGIVWPHAPAEPVLRATETGPASLGVRDPSVVVADGLTHLFHTATDGASFAVARATGGTRW